MLQDAVEELPCHVINRRLRKSGEPVDKTKYGVHDVCMTVGTFAPKTRLMMKVSDCEWSENIDNVYNVQNSHK